MKPAAFDYTAARSVDEALAVLSQYGDEAKVIAGGQTLGPMLNMRLLMPQVLLDINRVESLSSAGRGDGGLALGAATRQADLEDDPGLAEVQPLVAAAIPYIAHRAIRNRGTVGGSLVHADPAAEWGGLVHALDAELVIAGSDGRRTVAAEDFFVGILTTAVEPEELLVEVRLPAWPRGAGWSFVEFSRRHGDFALAGVACRLQLDGDRRCSDVRLGLIGLGDTPLRARDAEAVLVGESVGPELYRAAAETAARGIEPMSDLHASADYRRQLTRVLVADALAQAVDRASPGVDG
ncbi:MAG TPA: xanthine dehydrogenase family protein subunit M [Arenicellales bacterium]|nr:xanthine dehydrogenase family protein subunit M [Arenicellales bacterium]